MTKYLHNKEQNGIEIYFDGKPDSDVLILLKENKWRWNPKKFCWYNKYSKENEKFAVEVSQETIENKSELSVLDELSKELDEMLREHSKNTGRDEIVMGRVAPSLFVKEQRKEFDDDLLAGIVPPIVKGSIRPPKPEQKDLEVVVDDRLLEVVMLVIRDFGIEVLKNRVKAPSIFSDLLVSFGKEKHIVRMAIREGMVAKLLSVATESAATQRTTLVSAVEYMHEELGMDYKSSCAVLMTFQAAINKATPNVRGKSTCHKLKEMRHKFAEANGIEFSEEECTYDGPCNGTCPYCDSKTRELSSKAKELQKKGTVKYPAIDIGIGSSEENSDDIESCGTVPVFIEEGHIDEEDITMGDIKCSDFEDEDLPFN